LIILARTSKSLHKIAQAMCTLSLLFYRLSRGKTMPRFTGDNQWWFPPMVDKMTAPNVTSPPGHRGVWRHPTYWPCVVRYRGDSQAKWHKW